MRLKVVGSIACVLLMAIPAAAVEPRETGVVALSQADLDAIAKKRVLRYETALFPVAKLEAMAKEVEETGGTTLWYGGKAYRLALMPDTMFNPEVYAENPSMRAYRGTILGHEDSRTRVFMDLDSGVLHAFLRFADGTTYSVEPVYLRGGALHVWYNDDDALNVEGYSGAVPGPEAPAAAPVDAVEPVPTPEQVVDEVGNQSVVVPAAFPTGEKRYTLVRLRVYFDNGVNPSYIVQRMEDVFAREISFRFEVLGTTALNTNSFRDVKCGLGGGGADFLDDFAAAAPLSGTAEDTNDRAILFTENWANINYNVWHNGGWVSVLGCAWQPGSHSWTRWDVGDTAGGTDKGRAIVAEQEFAHNFNEGHCSGPNPNTGRYTIMCRNSDANTDETFPTGFTCTSSQGCPRTNMSSWGGTNMNYRSYIFNGADTSSHNVKLTWWEVRHHKSATAGQRIELERSWTSASGTVTLSQTFVGARNGADQNRDFGYQGSLTMNTWTNYWSGWEYTLPSSQTGTWYFWPAYDQCGSGCWGPYKWHAASVTVV